MRLVLVGPPGAGKGTQAEFIAEHFGDPEDLDRRHLPRQRVRRHRSRPAGQEVHGRRRPGPRRGHQRDGARPARRAGRRARASCSTGSRATSPQAYELDGILGEHRHHARRRARPRRRPRRGRAAAVRAAHLQEVRARLAPRVRPADGRRTSATSAAASCTSATTTSPETVRHRLEVYAEQTAPLIEFYGEPRAARRDRRARHRRGRHRARHRRAHPVRRRLSIDVHRFPSGSSSRRADQIALMRAGRAGRRRARCAR